MKRSPHKYLLTLALIVALLACTQTSNTPHQNNNFTMNTPFTQARAVYYGPFYEDMGLSTQVFEMEFFTQGLSLDSMGYLVGTGYHLYITDLFALTSDSIPPQDTYTVDSINYGQPQTIMPGKRIGDFLIGAQLTHVGQEFITSHLLTQGTLQLQWTNDTAHICINMSTPNKDKVQTYFVGKLPIYYIDYTQDKNPMLSKKRQGKNHVL